jgi:DNA-binding IclR family transcriptional regulator
VRAVAAPIRIGSEVLAALAVSGSRFDIGAATPRILQLADRLSANLRDG